MHRVLLLLAPFFLEPLHILLEAAKAAPTDHRPARASSPVGTTAGTSSRLRFHNIAKIITDDQNSSGLVKWQIGSRFEKKL
jgi:hypothetical protein